MSALVQSACLRKFVHRCFASQQGCAPPCAGAATLTIGVASDVLVAGEGIETMLSLRCVLPDMPMVAALSANHLAALNLPPALRRLYIARDNDAAGRHAAMRLRDRARAAGIETRILWPVTNDFNADLRRFGADALSARLRVQLTPEDADRFASGSTQPGASA